MNSRFIRLPRIHLDRGTRPIAFAVIAILLSLGLGAWLLIFKPHHALMLADDVHGRSMGQPPASNEPAPSNVQSMSLNQLLAEARKAMNRQRLLAPAGNNAFEFYLKVLERQPGNQVAVDALRETFPFGATAAEQSINQRDFAEAQRQIDLLAKADPSNYTLTILRSKLDAQRKLLDLEQQQALDQQKQQQQAQLASAKSPVDEAHTEAAPAPRDEPTAPPPAAAPAPPKPSAPTSATDTSGAVDPVLVHQYSPRYPAAAMRANQDGWVELEFTVDKAGSVSDVRVLDSRPHHVFDRAAVDAVSRWKFQPATAGGEPRAIKLQRRIQFTLKQ